jgi:hypothetical protein
MIVDTEIGPDDGIAPSWSGSGVAVGSTNFTCLRCNIHNFGDGVRANGGVTVQDSWIHDLGENSHNDGIQRYAPNTPGNDVIRHNFIDMGDASDWRNSAIFYSDSWQGSLVLDNNKFSGAYFTVQNLGGGSMTVTNNVWVDRSWKYGPTRFSGGTLASFSGNKTDTGAPL